MCFYKMFSSTYDVHHFMCVCESEFYFPTLLCLYARARARYVCANKIFSVEMKVLGIFSAFSHCVVFFFLAIFCVAHGNSVQQNLCLG